MNTIVVLSPGRNRVPLKLVNILLYIAKVSEIVGMRNAIHAKLMIKNVRDIQTILTVLILQPLSLNSGEDGI